MTRRGEELREHILLAAKDVFLEMGFERASMDLVAARAATSKRSLYAHFESKEKLFLAVIELVRTLFFRRLGTPVDDAREPADAVAMFCGRYLRVLLYEPSVQMCRMIMAEAVRFPQGAARHFDVVFTEARTRLAAYVETAFGVSPADAARAADRLLGQVLYPRLPRALFGLDPLATSFDQGAPSELDLAEIRGAVADMVASLAKP